MIKSLRYTAIAASVFIASAAQAVTVTPSDANGWQAANVRANGSVGITDTYKPAGQAGSLQFTTNMVVNGQDKADYVNYWGQIAGRTLGNISDIAYSWYRDSASSTAGHYMPAFRLAYTTSSGLSGLLVYENVYNGGAVGTPVTTDQWVNASITDANFWMRAYANGGQPSRTIEQYNVTLDDWKAGNTYGTSQQLGADTFITGIEVGVGSGWGGSFNGAVDNVSLAFGSDIVSANFEPNAVSSAVPEPASWAMMMVGLGVVGGGLRSRRRKVGVRFA